MNFRTFVQQLEKMKGKQALEATVKALPAEVREAIQYGRIVAGGWYPIAWYREMHFAAQKTCRVGTEFSRAVGHDGTIEDFRGIYRVAIALLSPETLFAQAPRLFKLYWEGGTAQKIEASNGAGRVCFSDWVGFDHNIWEEVAGGCEGLLEVCGAKRVRRKVLGGGGDKDGFLDIEFHWT